MSSLRGLLPTGVIVTVAVAISGCTAPGGSPEEDWRQGRIVFDSERDGNFEIYVMNADGSNQQRLTNWERGDQWPGWTPDGRRIAFTSWGREDGLRAAIFTMDPEGSNVTRLSKGVGKQGAPRLLADTQRGGSWSPDGKRILFGSNDMNGNEEDIFIMDADGSNVQRLTTTPGAGKFSRQPTWSPDGSWIAFDSNRDGNSEIYVMAADGSNVKRLTDTPGKQLTSKPEWSPDGKRILFGSSWDRRSDNPLEAAELCVMNADGSNVRRLTYTTDKGEGSWMGVWSPDGRQIAFVSGSGAKTPTGDQGRVALPRGDVSPQQWMAQWMASREIYVMDADGSNMQRLTFNEAFDGHPRWQPTRR